VGRPDQREARDYVLSPFTPAEREELPIVIAHAADAVELALREGIVAAMNTMNSNQQPAISGQPGGREAGQPGV